MVKRLISILKRNLPILVIFSLVLLIFLANFRPGNWLTGWDNLHPEFNFSLNIKRSLSSVWQEYQGLGLLGGMGHAADLPRQIFLAILSLFLPSHLLRYLFVFLMLFLGPLGVYFLLKFLLKKEFPAFLGALFYLLNLATVQFFYVPFEAFIAHYGFLPWLFYLALFYLETGSKKKLLFFFIISLFSATQSYVPTLFVVYLMGLFLVFLGIWLRGKRIGLIKKFSNLFLISLLTNAFWLLPFLYFTLISSSVVGSAWENFMATENIFLRNKEFGRIGDVALLKGFWFKFMDYNKNGELGYMVETWRNHLNSPLILFFGYLFFFVVLLGFITQFFKKQKYSLSLIFLFLFPVAILANDTPIISLLVKIIQAIIPLFWQAFRVPFTKFAVLAAFAYSLLFGFGCSYLLSKLNNRVKFIFCIFLTLMLMFYTLPIFQGNLIYEQNQLAIPKEYFEAMNFFKNINLNERIANFPQHTYWGWNYYNWGYVGSGFLWYGIKQPILDRAFDGYSQNNENYYWEINQAIYSQNLLLLEKVLGKYQISWLLLDGNIVSYTSPKSLYFDQLEKLISSSEKIKFSALFGKIKIYQVLLDAKPKDFVFLTQDLPKIEPVYKWNNFDKAFVDYGSYTSEVFPSPSANSSTSEVGVYYLFRSLFTGRKQEELEFKVEDGGDSFIFKARIPKELVGGKLVIPEISEPEVLEIGEDDLTKIKTVEPKVYFDGELMDYSFNSTSEESSLSARPPSEVSLPLSYVKEGNLEVKVPKVQGIFSYDSDKDSSFLNKESQTCDSFNKGKYSLEKAGETGKQFLRFSATDSSSCLDINLPNLGNRYSYLVTVESRNLKGKSMLFWLENLQSRKADIETYLPKFTSEESWLRKLSLPPSEVFQTSYFIQPPMERYGLGYSLHFNNISIGREETVNDFAKVTVNPVPYKFLTGIKIVNENNHLPGEVAPAVHLEGGGDLQVSHPNESFYKVEIPNTQSLAPSTYLVLSQSFNKDWLAFEKTGPLSFKKIKDHVLVNNWQNGWQLPTTNHQSPITVYIFFWPQLLEYLGFVLLLLTPIIVWKIPLDKSITK